MERTLDIWGGASAVDWADGETLRLLTAMEVLQARREAEELSQGDDREKALCSNACLLARALERDGTPVYPSGKAVLEGLRVEEIARLASVWAEFNRNCNPSAQDGQEAAQPLKKAWSTRLMSALNGACSEIFRRCPRKNGPET
jgi:phage FluMu protein gp41